MGVHAVLPRNRRLILLAVLSLVASLLTVGLSAPAALAAPGVSVSETSLGITENPAASPSDSYDVVLDEVPSGTVTVSVNIGGSTEFTVDQTTLLFTTGDWDTPQTVTVTSVDDAIDDGVSSSDITHSASGGGYDGVVIGSVTVSVADNDTAGVTVNPLTNAVEETGAVLTDGYNVALLSEPTGDVTFTMTVDPTDGLDVTALSDPGGLGFLTFTPANWNVPQSVEITAVDDDIDEPSTHVETIFHTVSGGGYDGVTVASGTVNVFDTDEAGVTINEGGGVAATEGGANGSYSIVLDTEPTEDVTISLTPQGTEATATATVGGAGSLVFTAANWSTPQFVTVTAVDDDVVDGSTSETIDHAASSSDPFYDGGTPVIASVTASISDDDVAGVSVTPTTVNVTEGGATGTYDVVLDTQPTGDVTVTITPQGTEATAVATVGGTGSLIFSSGNWDAPQEVTVTAVDDAAIDGATTETIDHAATGSGYDGVVIDSVTVNVTDDDTPGISISGSPTVSEPSGSGSYDIELTTIPSGDVTITLSESSDEFSITSATVLTFTVGNWNLAQTVTVQATDDDVVDGQQTGVVTNTPAGGGYGSVTPVDVTVTVNDDDTKGITIVESSGTSVTEGGATDSYTVELDSEPMGTVTVTIGSTTGEASVGDTTLTFDAGNWDSPQVVTVTATDDDVDDGQTSEVFTHSASGADYAGVTGANVTATVNDDDTRGITVAESSGTTVSEDGTTDTYTVVLDSEPTGTVTVAVAPTTGEATVSPTSLTFTSGDWSTAQTVTVTAVDDARVDGDTSEVITHSASGGDYAGITGASVTATVEDDDVAGVTITETDGSTLVVEGGLSDTYDVVLTAEPTGSVTVTATADAQIAVTPPSVTFTPGDWSVAQTVTVNGVEDNTNEADPHDGLVTHSSASTDTAFDGLSIAGVTVDVVDADALLVSVDGPTIGAPGEVSTFTATVVSGGAGTITYEWVVTTGGLVVDTGTTATFEFTPDSGGLHEVAVIVGDMNGDNPAVELELKVLGDIEGSVFVADIVWLAEEGITLGCNPPANDLFCPNDNVTRGQMAAFLVRFLGLTDDGGGNMFVDDDGSIFEDAIAKLAAAEITLGCNPPLNDRFCPNDPVTRGQMAAFIRRANNILNP